MSSDFFFFFSAESRNLVYFEGEKTWLQAKKTCLECGGELVDWDESVSEIVSKSDIENTITWIGNYTVENPWIKEEGCMHESDLTDESYNFIYHNNPEFCSRTCKTDQMFALKEERCFCIENYNALTILPCNETSSNQQLNITVYSMGYVYNCSFEKDSCTNTSYGEETMGLTWRRTEDNVPRNIGNFGVVNKGHYLLLEYLTTEIMNKARVLIRLNLTETYFCLTFKYYIDHSGSLEIFVNEPNTESHIVWKSYGNKGYMWYLASLDIKGHSDSTIEIYGSLEDKYYKTSTVAIDEMTILPGSCNKEKRLDCSFDRECEWDQGSAWKIVRENKGNFYLKTADDIGSFELNGFGVKRHIATTHCLQFDFIKMYWDRSFYVYKNQAQLFSGLNFKAEWQRTQINIPANYPYYVKLNGSISYGYFGINNISLRSGSCGQVVIM
ncbi:hypothetical protein KUTeg_015622 [Tegillarca granosa]|uniref:MAM domain-containing protein n=1 Tax=Tegillarca granosa TaxID=220873 RepID=A0ABQ9EQP1_TEGGR|nr:hypothetical protein KUTeg_015622 [Tegillarca granosa]